MKVAVVTPTVGAKQLEQCVQSVQQQTYEDITHYIFIDGEQYYDEVTKVTFDRPNIKQIYMEENVGKGWYGHRVYAACGFLVNADVICYLDEDNWLEPNHVEKLVAKIKEGADWAFSLRKIVDKDGEFVCEDNCESLGEWPVYFNKDQYHIDTSSFMVKRDIAVRIGQTWYGQWGADRQFFSALKQYFPKFECSREYSLNYRLDGNENSVNKEFFDKGNTENEKQYPNGFPWKQKGGKKLIVGPGITIVGA
jgi:glycosyltransferase involved in cell wall biosynthesis